MIFNKRDTLNELIKEVNESKFSALQIAVMCYCNMVTEPRLDVVLTAIIDDMMKKQYIRIIPKKVPELFMTETGEVYSEKEVIKYVDINDDMTMYEKKIIILLNSLSKQYKFLNAQNKTEANTIGMGIFDLFINNKDNYKKFEKEMRSELISIDKLQRAIDEKEYIGFDKREFYRIVKIKNILIKKIIIPAKLTGADKTREVIGDIGLFCGESNDNGFGISRDSLLNSVAYTAIGASIATGYYELNLKDKLMKNNSGSGCSSCGGCSSCSSCSSCGGCGGGGAD